MSAWLIYTIGFLAQILFSSRCDPQRRDFFSSPGLEMKLFLSERSGRIITPSIFWKLSLLASFLLFVYGYFRQDLAIMLGQALTYFIYIRNLELQGEWGKSPRAIQYFLLLFPLIIILYGYNNGKYDLSLLLYNEAIPRWLMILGIVSQVLFTFRFVYQWLYSERNKVSDLPVGFWRISAAGASLILVYAIFRKDPVLFLGHIAGLTIYLRNIFIYKKSLA